MKTDFFKRNDGNEVIKGTMVRKYNIKLILFLCIILISHNVYSQSCFKLDSILTSSKKYILGTIKQDTLLVEVKSKVSEKMISDAFNTLELNTKNRFYLVYNCKTQKMKQTMSFNIIEYRKEDNGRLIEGYEWTSCATFYRCYNKAYFKIRKGEVNFVKWDLE